MSRYGSDIIGYAPRPLVLYGTGLLALTALAFVVIKARHWVTGRPAARAAGAREAAKAAKPTRAELDALDDALDEEDGF